MIKKDMYDHKRGETKQNRKHPEDLPWTQKHDPDQNRTQKKVKTHMQNKDGNNKYHRQDIADVFAEFYDDLCTSTTKKHEHEHEDKSEQPQDSIKQFTRQELNDDINQLKRGEATEKLQKHLLRLYSKDIKPLEQTSPNSRDTTSFFFFSKSGDPTSTSNFRPTCSIPIFSQLLLRRLQPTLDDNQTTHQADFRPDYSTTDCLYAFQQTSTEEDDEELYIQLLTKLYDQ